jgi:hypothetical protein
VVLAAKDLVADARNEIVGLSRQASARMIGGGGATFEDRVGRDHLARDQVAADAEMLEGPLGLRSPQFARWNLYLSQTVGFDPEPGCPLSYGGSICNR